MPAIGFFNLGSDIKKGIRTLEDENSGRMNAYVLYQTSSIVTAGAGIMIGWMKYCQPYYEQVIDKLF